MIKIMITSGPRMGQTVQIVDGKSAITGLSVGDPVDVLQDLVTRGWAWKLKFSSATDQEVIEWGRADMIVRILRALFQGLSVHFDGQEYSLKGGLPVELVVGAIEDAIANVARWFASVMTMTKVFSLIPQAMSRKKTENSYAPQAHTSLSVQITCVCTESYLIVTMG